MLRILFLISTVAWAQDTRHVTEPHIPAACTTLTGSAAIDETKLDTRRIQQAIDQCAPGQAVALKSGVFVSGPLELKSGITLWIDAGATLYASRNPVDFEIAPGKCGITDDSGRGCKPLIGGDGITDAAVMGDGTIDGRGGEKLIGRNFSWWDLAEEARTKNNHQNVPRLVVIAHARNFTLYRITLRNSPNFHVTFAGDGFTAWGVKIFAPKSRNTDGIDPGNATNVTITHCFIHAGDDQVAIKAPGSHMTISHNHFYAGHGMSIGSETYPSVTAIRVTDLSIDGSDNGLRIKSNSGRGGLVEDVVYEDVCIRQTKNPIFMDSNYAFADDRRDRPPQYRGIVFRDVRIVDGGKLTFDGLDPEHRLGMILESLTVLGKYSITARHADFDLQSTNLMPSGDDVHTKGHPAATTGKSCSEKFVPFPDRR